MPAEPQNIILNEPALIHESAVIHGKVRIEQGASLWPYTVIRSEMFEVVIGKKTNIQDFVMIHVGAGTGTFVGDYCNITHHCTLHGCTIGDNCLIGINSTIMDGCVIGKNCIIAGHTILKEGTIIPDNSIVAGQPGKVIKTKNCAKANRTNAIMYYEMALAFTQDNYRPLTDPDLLKRVFKDNPEAEETN